MAVIENDVIKVTVSSSSTRNVIRVSPGVSALSSVSLSLNELNDVDITGIEDGQTIVYEGGSFVAGDAGAVKTINNEEPDADGNVDVSINDLTDVKIASTPAEGDALIFSNNFWTTGDAGASVLDDLTDVNVPTPAPGAVLKYNGSQWTAQALSIPSVPATYYHQRYATDAQTFLTGATETVELYYTARADGDGLHESAQSDTPTAGYDIQRKLYYSEKAKADPDTSADWTQFTAIADNTSYNDAKTALLAYLNERTGGTSPISLKITWEEVVQAPSFTGLLNEAYGSGAEAAYSTRRLNGNVTDCMVIRRDSDGTTQSIGFVGEEIDEAAIETFCTGTTCTVATWYDQSGNGNNATQPTPANQPTIYTGGRLVKEGGRLALDFDGSDDTLSTTYQPQLGTASTADLFTFAVSSQASSHRGTIWRASDSDRVVFNRWDSSNFQSTYRDSDRVIVSGVSSALSLNNQYLLTGSLTNGAVTNYVDGTINGTGSVSFTGDLNLSSPFYIGSRGGTGERLNGNLQELIFYTSDKSSVRTDIEGNISAYFQSAKLLDEQFGEGAEAAYSTRQLRRDQTDCMVIRRASDSTTTTIGFDANGNIDETAIETFCTGTTCTVVTWKDQSGNGNDATAAASTNEPTIYTGGALVKENGKVAITFSQSTNFDAVNITGASSVDFFNVFSTTDTRYILNGGSGLWSFAAQDASTTVISSGFGTPSYRVNGTSASMTTRGDGYTTTATGNRMLLNAAGDSSTWSNYSIIYRSQTGDTFNLDGNLQEAIYFTTDKSSVRTSIEENIADYFTQNTPLLDTYSGAAAAYSLRKLNSSYTGPAIEVYAGTNGTADIGFNVFGELDTVALAAHCGSNDGTVQTWYDQSGNGNHATQGVTGSQPKIYDGTTGVLTLNGKPSISTLTGQGLTFTAISLNDLSTFIIGNTPANAVMLYGNSNATRLFFTSTNYIMSYSGITNGEYTVPATDNSNSHLRTLLREDGVSESVYYDGSQLTQIIQGGSGQINVDSLGPVRPGDVNRVFQEIIIYTSDQSSNRTNIEDNINTFYNIY